MDAALALPTAAAKVAALSALLHQLVAALDREGVCQLAQALLDEGKCSRDVAGDALRALPPRLEEVVCAVPASAAGLAFAEAVCVMVVDALKASQASALDDVDVHLRDVLYDVKMQQGQYTAAGTALAGAKIDSAARIEAPVKAYLWVRVVQAFLRCEDDVSADRFIKRAADLYRHMTKETQMSYHGVMAQMLDYRRTKDGSNFQQAAVKYEDVSRRGQALGFPADQLLHFLSQAVRCILLAPVGPARVRIMSSLSRDDRIAFIQVRAWGAGRGRTVVLRPSPLLPRPPPSFPLHTRTLTPTPPLQPPMLLSMLQRMSTERLISAPDAAAFEATLPQHCRAANAAGVTIFGKAVAEHNVLAASRVYKNISFASLGVVLGMAPEAAQAVVARMVSEGRLSAAIDQVDAVIDFLAEKGGSAVDPDAVSMRAWDKGIKDVCSSINSLVEALK